jgi:hypothetical protein
MKRRDTKLTGHWKSAIHDYLPGFGNEIESNEGRRAMTLREVNPEDRVLLRRELIELGKQLAQEERKQQRKALLHAEDY